MFSTSREAAMKFSAIATTLHLNSATDQRSYIVQTKQIERKRSEYVEHFFSNHTLLGFFKLFDVAFLIY